MYAGISASADPLQTEFSLPAASIQSSSINQVSSWRTSTSIYIHITIQGVYLNFFSGIVQGAIYAEPSVEAAQQQPPSTSDTTHTVSAGESEDYSYSKMSFLFSGTLFFITKELINSI